MMKQRIDVLKTSLARSVGEIADNNRIAASNGKRKSMPKTPSSRSGTQSDITATTRKIENSSGASLKRPVRRPNTNMTRAKSPNIASVLVSKKNIGERIAKIFSAIVP